CGVALVFCVGAGPDGEERAGRFAMTPVEGGFLRMDTQTGAVSLCQRSGPKWSCEAVSDDRGTLQREIDRLSAENRALQEQLDRADPAGKDRRADRGSKFQMPSDEDVDRALTYMQRMMRLFKEKMRELDSDKDRRSL